MSTLLRFLLLLWLLQLLLLLLPEGSFVKVSGSKEKFISCSPPDYTFSTGTYHPEGPVTAMDSDILNFALNVEYFECEFFMGSLYGVGLDKFAPYLTGGGPPPIGLEIANLDYQTRDIVFQFGLQEIGHIRAIRETIEDPIPRPQLDLGVRAWAKFFDEALGHCLNPPFNPYANSLNYVIAMYCIPYVGLTGYVGGNPNITSHTAKRLLAGLLGVEAGQDAVIRYWLYERRNWEVYPYAITVAEMTGKISDLRNCLGRTGIVDEGILVPKELGAEGRVSGNILSADPNSLAYSRTPREILRVLYGTGNESIPSGFYPLGANGRIARSYLHYHQ